MTIIKSKDVLVQINEMLSTKITDVVSIITVEDVKLNAFGNPVKDAKGKIQTEMVSKVKVRNTADMSDAAIKSIAETCYYHISGSGSHIYTYCCNELFWTFSRINSTTQYS